MCAGAIYFKKQNAASWTSTTKNVDLQVNRLNLTWTEQRVNLREQWVDLRAERNCCESIGGVNDALLLHHMLTTLQVIVILNASALHEGKPKQGNLRLQSREPQSERLACTRRHLTPYLKRSGSRQCSPDIFPSCVQALSGPNCVIQRKGLRIESAEEFKRSFFKLGFKPVRHLH